MSPFVTRSFWNTTPLNIKLKAFTMSGWKTTQSRWRSKVHPMLWIIVAHPLLVATLNWCKEKFVVKVSQNWTHKVQLVNWYNISPTTMDKLHLRAWSWLRGEALQGHVQFDAKCDLVLYENKVKIIVGNHSHNLISELFFEGVQKPSQNDHL